MAKVALVPSGYGAEGVTELIVLFVELVFVILILLLAHLAHSDTIRNAGGFFDRRTESHVDAVADGKRQINRAAKNLRDKGLMDHRWNITVEKEHYHLWRDADHLANPRSRSDGGSRSLRDLILDYLEGYECHQCFSCGRELGIHLDYIERMMKKAGYNQRQLLEYWNDVVYEPGYCNRRLDLVEVFAGRGFMPVFNLAEEMTAENRIGKGYVGISLGLLRRLSQYELLKIKDMDGKTNSKGEPVLKYYEPDHQRLRKGAWTAA